ncbi:3-phosphoserine/phosphohydroxythreonine transaminase [Rhodopirellula sp. MGV]|uniref:3-phosphoserine/phosphohydroxythreonine transaminase n=1 Tax=Rhodopirellula sp. MGV TaxID=2023130 RepID=UPI000B9781F6|nr:3-phosphoserine/phosphohydroxythreonine transaminase [Rhodopirellula sp. MGV]OYP30395.1 phosphoserine transaminase [Rhodopirellula sp. MGV]PNY34764.1 3-phosphoserine/phosphohydroxythreonine transaminase [Rhodopirellula baltica]
MSAPATDQRAYNFSAGPAVLPVSVLEEVRDEMLCLPGARTSLLEMSHRDKAFVDILHDAENSIRSLLKISDDYSVMFLQGGAALQFSMIPANLLRGTDKSAAYLQTGTWGKKAIGEAKKEGKVNVVYDASSSNFNHVPTASDYEVASDAAYLYYCSNETIQGVQFHDEPKCPESVPLICDASSDFMHRPLDISKYGMVYACAQKNAGPAGVTVVIMRKDLLEIGSESLPGYMQYKLHAENDSEWNTPPTFAIWVLGKVARWLSDDIGGLDAMEKINREKASLLYDAIDGSNGFYTGHAKPDCRSLMNATFVLPNDELQASFLSEAAGNGLVALKGHRSVGGIRASIYNAMPLEGAKALADFMTSFAAKNG